MTNQQIRDTKDMVATNFKLFSKFSKIFLKLQFNMNPLTQETEKLKREY